MVPFVGLSAPRQSMTVATAIFGGVRGGWWDLVSTNGPIPKSHCHLMMLWGLAACKACLCGMGRSNKKKRQKHQTHTRTSEVCTLNPRESFLKDREELQRTLALVMV